MKIRLGYVSIPLTLQITCSKTLTYTRFQELGKDTGKKQIQNIIISNLDNLKKVLLYNYKNHIHFYRLTSHLLPLVTHPNVSFSYYVPFKKYYNELSNLINKYNIRVDMHPDQYVVLNSEKNEVVENTIRILKYHDRLLKELGIINGRLIIHVGSSAGGKEEALKRFKENFYKLPNSIRKRLALENDDKVFDMVDVLHLCQELNLPMVLDYHHFLCHNKGEKIEDYIGEIFDTWNMTDLVPKIHFSSPKNKTKKDFRSHSDYICGTDFVTFLEKIKFLDRDFDVMIEAKAKDRALFDLTRWLKYKTSYIFLDETTFVV